MRRYLWYFCIVWLWAGTLGLLVGGCVVARHYLLGRPETRTVLLLPLNRMDAERRTQEVRRLVKYPEFAAARWLSPNDLAQTTADQLPRDQWPELFSTEEAWLPWLLEAELSDPVGQLEESQSRIDHLRQETTWRLVTWDQPLASDSRYALQRVHRLSITLGLLIFAFGLSGIALSPRVRASRSFLSLIGCVGTALALAIYGFALLAAFGPQQPRVWGFMAATGFLLAGVIAPMIKSRTKSPPPASPAVSEPPVPEDPPDPKIDSGSPTKTEEKNAD